jgi:hypothetical protein
MEYSNANLYTFDLYHDGMSSCEKCSYIAGHSLIGHLSGTERCAGVADSCYSIESLAIVAFFATVPVSV